MSEKWNQLQLSAFSQDIDSAQDQPHQSGSVTFEHMGSITPTHLKVVLPKSLTWDYIASPRKSARRCFLISVDCISRPKAGGSPLNKHWVCKLLQGLSSKQDAKILKFCVGMVMKYPLPRCQKSLKEIYLWILLVLKSFFPTAFSSCRGGILMSSFHLMCNGCTFHPRSGCILPMGKVNPSMGYLQGSLSPFELKASAGWSVNEYDS